MTEARTLTALGNCITTATSTPPPLPEFDTWVECGMCEEWKRLPACNVVPAEDELWLCQNCQMTEAGTLTQQEVLVMALKDKITGTSDGVVFPFIDARLDQLEQWLVDLEARFRGVECGMLIIRKLRELARLQPQLTHHQREKVEAIVKRAVTIMKRGDGSALQRTAAKKAVRMAARLRPCGCKDRSCVMAFEPKTTQDHVRILVQDHRVEVSKDHDLGTALQACGFVEETAPTSVATAKALYLPGSNRGFVRKGRKKWYQVIGGSAVPRAVSERSVISTVGTQTCWIFKPASRTRRPPKPQRGEARVAPIIPIVAPPAPSADTAASDEVSIVTWSSSIER